MAHLTVMFYNANRGKGGRSLDAGDFFPSLAQVTKARLSKEDMKVKIQALKAHIRAIRNNHGR